MLVLLHHPFCPQSRFIRLVAAEMGRHLEFREERPWEWNREFLLLNPAGTTPVLLDEPDVTACGHLPIVEYLDEVYGRDAGEKRLMPDDPLAKLEVRRITDWFTTKFHDEVSRVIFDEKIAKRYSGGSPEMAPIRAAKSNIRLHLRYIGYLMRQRAWLGGDMLSLADLAAAAHLSVVDYCGDVPWEEDEEAKDWYLRIKSRPSFRLLMNDRLPGIAPAPQYALVDF
jgi:glutathione S-transferase